MLLLLIWVDDVWAAYTKGAREKIFIPWLKIYRETFKLKLLGEIKLFVGINITRDRAARTITLSQAEYVKTMVRKFLTEDELKVAESLPAVVYDKAGRETSHSKLLDITNMPIVAKSSEERTQFPFLSACASAMYATSVTRFDWVYQIGAILAIASLCCTPEHACFPTT